MAKDSEFIQRVAKKWKFLDLEKSSLRQNNKAHLYSRTRAKFHEKQKELARIERNILNQNDVNTSSDLVSYQEDNLNIYNEIDQEIPQDEQFRSRSNLSNKSNLTNRSELTAKTNQSNFTNISSPSLSHSQSRHDATLRSKSTERKTNQNVSFNLPQSENDEKIQEELKQILGNDYKKQLEEIMKDQEDFQNEKYSETEEDQYEEQYEDVHVRLTNIITNSNSASPYDDSFTQQQQQREERSLKLKLLTERFGLDIAKDSLRRPSSSEALRQNGNISSRILSSSPTYEMYDEPSYLEINPIQVSDDDTPLTALLLPQNSSKVISVPKFKTLHPLTNIEECVDIPAELKIPNYLEDPTFTRYKIRLAEYVESNAKPKRFNPAEGYGVWYVKPDKWNQHMKSIREKQNSALETHGNESNHDMLTRSYQQTTRVITTETTKKNEDGVPLEVSLPQSVQILKSHLPPLAEEKQRQIESLHASRKFKEYLIRTHGTIPQWLSNVPVSEHIIDDAKQGVINNTAIPIALQASNAIDKDQSQSSNDDSMIENDTQEKDPKKETPMQRNFNDLKYIGKYVQNINSAVNTENKGFSIGHGPHSGIATKRRPEIKSKKIAQNSKSQLKSPKMSFHSNVDPPIQIPEEQHPDIDSRPRRSIPLSTMIRLTTERRKLKIMKDMEDSLKESRMPIGIEETALTKNEIDIPDWSYE